MEQDRDQVADGKSPAKGPLNRRLFLFKSLAGVATVGMAAAVVTAATVEPAQAQYCSDRDPYDPYGRGRWCRRRVGCSDNDPYDPWGRGRWCGRRRVVCSDRDPYDPYGRGRWCR
jgi:hypothetical protein